MTIFSKPVSVVSRPDEDVDPAPGERHAGWRGAAPILWAGVDNLSQKVVVPLPDGSGTIVFEQPRARHRKFDLCTTLTYIGFDTGNTGKHIAGKRGGKVATNSGNTGKAATHSGKAANVVSLPRWLNLPEAAKALGISKRTVRYRGQHGQLKRQKDGRRTLYWVDPMPAIPATGHRQPAAGKNDESGKAAMLPATPATKAAAIPATDDVEAKSGVSELITLIERLTDRVVELERDKVHLEHERDDALTVGHQIADKRDELVHENVRLMALIGQAHGALSQSNADVKRLHEAVDSVTDAVAIVCASHLAVPVRRRLRAALATC